MKKIEAYEGTLGDNIEWCAHYMLLKRDMNERENKDSTMFLVFNTVCLRIDKYSTYNSIMEDYKREISKK